MVKMLISPLLAYIYTSSKFFTAEPYIYTSSKFFTAATHIAFPIPP
jgi:hypothetical protein